MALKVLVTSRTEKIFDGVCTSLTSNNDVGEFDVLEQHANFISLIKDYIILNKDSQNEQKIDIESGVLTCESDSISAYVRL